MSYDGANGAQAGDSLPVMDESRPWNIFDGMDAFWVEENLLGQDLGTQNLNGRWFSGF